MQATPEQHAYLAMISLPKVTPATLREHLAAHPDPLEAWELWRLQYHLPLDFPEETMVKLWERGVDIVTPLHEDYPAGLQALHDPPLALYTIGRTELLRHRALAIVGTRTPTRYGAKYACSMARELAGAGITVVSGLAMGIDAQAHRGALDAGGDTIAVLGTGVDVIYPKDNAELYHRIAEKGLLVSEYPPGIAARSYQFPQRNRIIAALSRGVFVPEAGTRSGARITVNVALELGLEVMALPGNADAFTSNTPNELIREGATLVTCADHIFQAMGWSRPGGAPSAAMPPAQLTMEEALVVRLLQGGDRNYSSLIEALDISIPQLSALLTGLTVKGVVEALPGKVYHLV